YGPGRAIVSVDATLNFDEVRRTVQDLVPAPSQGNVRRRRQTTGGSVADPASGFDNTPAVPRGTSDVEYDYGRSIEQVVAAPGGVTRLSVGVIVPADTDRGAQDRIEELVRVAAGIDDARGDVVVVQSIEGLGASANEAPAVAAPAVESESPLSAAPPVVAAVAQPWWKGWYVWAGGGLLLAALLLVVSLRPREGSARLSSEERARLLADVKSSLERGPRMNPAGANL
ncbi:MAG TPA: flagellar M-ring protein FliF C-terminal domain-containing protein, partial [Planctomycetota bacterium]|nr:flagellar M-ring protein FliF C-terminal domain-containing protein [Planctomycetota bacterium]